MLVIHKLDGTDWFVKGIKLNTRHQGLITIRLLMLPDFVTPIVEQAITRIFNDEAIASKEFAKLRKIMDASKKEVFGMGEDFAINYEKTTNSIIGEIDGLPSPLLNPIREEEKTTKLPATCRYCLHEGTCDQQVGDEGHIVDCPYFDYKAELPECVVCEERFEGPQVGYKLVCPACIKKGYFQEHTDEYIAQQRKLLKERQGEIPIVVKSQLTEDFLLYGAAYLVMEKEGDSTVFKVISPKDLTIVFSTDNDLINKDKIGEMTKRFGGRLWVLSCPHCGDSSGLVVVHLTDSIITDHNVTLACYCHKCEKKFKVSYVSLVGLMDPPRPKCEGMIVTECEGCSYYISNGKCAKLGAGTATDGI